ncbi:MULTISPECIES: hypothetical protein [Pseudoalteromonas]|uniref:hypothetical protein n=1 Tax=Pseudoalteromonas TaxID=53246 RepID=UPI0002CA72C7|nr:MULTISPECIES: hypothetical protein [Pseudoalteromonas]ENN99066.1 hypothetical protein J139_08938 [Pseudoalteromonas agarivorans S816]TMS65123.1 hypothetical protein CWB83_14090 [Pseudoalteromonas sp. S1691]TMS70702.1 hypothetical protein CWB86_07220 [Pseudoalteromonas sp. S1731]TMS72943.1 hypothetical protein CWB88_13560 [Pseudoalteromonas sp. S1941]TMS77969.1 hypothetical protein CWB82_08270 [Pseudoalteromonas sp. S1690]
MSIKNIPEPERLKEFRLANPNATWNQLKSDSDVNNALKVTAIKKTAGLCVYCEHKLIAKTDYQIEHFHPKKGNNNSDFGAGKPNWAINWDNLYPGCLGGTAQVVHFTEQYDIDFRTGANRRNKGRLTCGQKKGEIDPEGLIIKPTELNNRDPIFLFNGADGSISLNVEACRRQNISTELGESQIVRLNLNSQRLKDARLELASSLRTQFDKAFQFDGDAIEELVEDWLALNENEMYELPFISMISSKYERS